MGTRNLTMVINKEGDKKIAQYGQWDGYPSGVGISVLSFLKNQELFDKLCEKLSKVRFLDSEGIDKDFIESYNKNAPKWSNQPDNRTDEQKQWFSTYCSRDLADEVLSNIANSNDNEIILIDNEDSAKGSGWVEYSYVINLKENTFGIYGHLDHPPMKVYSLDELPEEATFLSDLEYSEED